VLTGGTVRRGDAEAALAASAATVTGSFETSYVEHAYIEPEAGYAFMDGDTLVIKACTQAPIMDRDDTAAILGLPPRRCASSRRPPAAASAPSSTSPSSR
jgi:aldehyde oxidoreductase